MNKRKLKAQETKKNLDEAIKNLLSKKDIKEITVKNVCNEAGVAIGTFYKYYTSKEELALVAISNFSNYFKEIAEERFNKDSIEENMKDVVKYYCCYAQLKNVDFIKRAFVSKLNYKAYDKGQYIILREVINKIVKKAQDNKEISSEKNSLEITEFFLGSLRGQIFNWCLSDGDYDLYDKTINLIRIIIKGLK